MNPPKVVARRRTPRIPEELHMLGACLDRELSVVRLFVRKRGFVFKARSWNELAQWESQRLITEHRQRNQ